MKISIKLFILFSFCIANAIYAKEPSTFSLVTFSIGSYENDWQEFTGYEKETSEALITSFRSNLNETYPNTVSFTAKEYLNSEVTKSRLIGNTPNQYNFVFFKGHGSPNEIVAWPRWQYVHNYEKKIGGNTYWVMIRSCQVFKNGQSNQDPWFGGVHSILGYSSNALNYPRQKLGYDCGPFGWFTCTYSAASYFVERDFATNWIKNKQGIFMAYANAVFKWIHQAADYGVEPKIVYRYGYVDGKFFDPWEETFENSIQKPVFETPGSYSGIGSRWYTWGTPEY